MVEIVYVDNHILVLNKPAGMLTQPNDTDDLSLESWGKSWLKERFQKQGNVFLTAVHRLDRPVSGLVLFARTSKALSRLNEAQRNQQFYKEYCALTEGRFAEHSGALEHDLKRSAYCSYVVDKKSSGTKKCLLTYHALQNFKGCTLLKITLQTGRYHQIRVQLAAAGHPIFGDQKYGSKQASEFLFLHHALLVFPHPITQEQVQCRAPFPLHWHRLGISLSSCS